ncbi:hypothetical protein NC653_034168 [Populus alba x Populus x berolinensis]|uniref:Uncharacterized protein n=1 Tax=Populus alba x Populus x berolinensis TaxID=444605 RepID=A0AAD6LM70_9ROSI|nr:hypothetical protein NC653_034168 [Populus alba x Populus x berolinensis]
MCLSPPNGLCWQFSFFCSDRENIIGRRIWESGRSYYCVTKLDFGCPVLLTTFPNKSQGVPSSSVPRRDKPRRVDLYYSSWCIQLVESRKGDGQLTSCEVLLFHHEDMGIPWEIAKLGVRHGMWGIVKKIEPGLHAYQRIRASGVTLSRPAFMAQINTKINPELMKSLGDDEDLTETEAPTAPEKSLGRNIPKLLIVGRAIALACGFDRGLLTKAFIFSVGRRFGNMGKNAKLNAGST